MANLLRWLDGSGSWENPTGAWWTPPAATRLTLHAEKCKFSCSQFGINSHGDRDPARFRNGCSRICDNAGMYELNSQIPWDDQSAQEIPPPLHGRDEKTLEGPPLEVPATSESEGRVCRDQSSFYRESYLGTILSTVRNTCLSRCIFLLQKQTTCLLLSPNWKGGTGPDLGMGKVGWLEFPTNHKLSTELPLKRKDFFAIWLPITADALSGACTHLNYHCIRCPPWGGHRYAYIQLTMEGRPDIIT